MRTINNNTEGGNMSKANEAVKMALTGYAKSAGITIAEAVASFKAHASTRECIALLVLTQADAAGLRKIAG
jgi:hypothetical protein